MTLCRNQDLLLCILRTKTDFQPKVQLLDDTYLQRALFQPWVKHMNQLIIIEFSQPHPQIQDIEHYCKSKNVQHSVSLTLHRKQTNILIP